MHGEGRLGNGEMVGGTLPGPKLPWQDSLSPAPMYYFSPPTAVVRPAAIGLAFNGWVVGAVTVTIAAVRLAVLCRLGHTIPPTTRLGDNSAVTKAVLAASASTPFCYRLLQETQ